MTPKEKAFHLHFSYIRDVTGDNDKAKIGAMKVVHEILSLNVDSSFQYKSEDGYIWTTFYAYWSEVLIEISKL